MSSIATPATGSCWPVEEFILPSTYSSFRQPQFDTVFGLHSLFTGPQPFTVLQMEQLVLGVGAGFRRLVSATSFRRSATRGFVIVTRPSPSTRTSSIATPVDGSGSTIEGSILTLGLFELSAAAIRHGVRTTCFVERATTLHRVADVAVSIGFRCGLSRLGCQRESQALGDPRGRFVGPGLPTSPEHLVYDY